MAWIFFLCSALCWATSASTLAVRAVLYFSFRSSRSSLDFSAGVKGCLVCEELRVFVPDVLG
jgi:hypothetical protein